MPNVQLSSLCCSTRVAIRRAIAAAGFEKTYEPSKIAKIHSSPPEPHGSLSLNVRLSHQKDERMFFQIY
jgi:hypothetical protein